MTVKTVYESPNTVTRVRTTDAMERLMSKRKITRPTKERKDGYVEESRQILDYSRYAKLTCPFCEERAPMWARACGE
jgi:hypothetical protein